MERLFTTQVDAPTDDVWRLFVDVERWPELTESIREVSRIDSGPLRVGSEALVKQPGLARARWKVTELEPGRSFTWEAAAGGVTSVGAHVVEPGEGGSTITLSLRQTGPMSRLVGWLLGSRINRYLSMELEGFRRGAESPQD
jgi:uncharacterized membrane protein